MFGNDPDISSQEIAAAERNRAEACWAEKYGGRPGAAERAGRRAVTRQGGGLLRSHETTAVSGPVDDPGRLKAVASKP
jgi:hypothetical protein